MENCITIFNMSKENLDYLSKVLSRRSFYGLMDLYEKNHALLCRLIPDLNKMPVKTESRVNHSPTLYLSIEKRCKYTTMLSITYYFEGADENKIADPDLHVRIYHDAKQVEAMSCKQAGQITIDKQCNLPRTMIDFKWENNLFLERWLKYSLAQGHIFSPENQVKSVAKELETVCESG